MIKLTIHDLDFMEGYINELHENVGLSDETFNEVIDKIKKERIKIKQ